MVQRRVLRQVDSDSLTHCNDNSRSRDCKDIGANSTWISMIFRVLARIASSLIEDCYISGFIHIRDTMARLRKDKGEKLRSGPKTDKSATATKASASQKSSKSSKSKPDALREQIQALGGTADDFDLVKDVHGDGPLNGGRAEDDVRHFQVHLRSSSLKYGLTCIAACVVQGCFKISQRS